MISRILGVITAVLALNLVADIDNSCSQSTGLHVTPGDLTLTLSWQPVDPGSVSHYELYRSVYNGYIRVDKTATSFIDENLDNGFTYYYSLVAVHPDGSKKEIAGRTIGTPIDLAPVAPRGFRAIGRNGEVRLKWTLNQEEDMARYVLYRATGDQSGPGTAIATLSLTDSSYLDSDVTNATLYAYSLLAIDEAWNQSPPVRHIASPGYVPEGLFSYAGDRTVRLNWKPNPYGGLSHYQLYRTTDRVGVPADQDTIARLAITDTSFTDKGLQYGQTYFYYLAMVDANGYSNRYVEPVSAAPQDINPQAPGGLKVSAGTREATLEWMSPPDDDVSHIYLYRSLSSDRDVNQEAAIAQMERNATTYTDPGLRAGTTYYYFLIAEDQSGKRSVQSPQVSATIPKPRYKARDLTFFLLATQFFLVPLAIAF